MVPEHQRTPPVMGVWADQERGEPVRVWGWDATPEDPGDEEMHA